MKFNMKNGSAIFFSELKNLIHELICVKIFLSSIHQKRQWSSRNDICFVRHKCNQQLHP